MDGRPIARLTIKNPIASLACNPSPLPSHPRRHFLLCSLASSLVLLAPYLLEIDLNLRPPDVTESLRRPLRRARLCTRRLRPQPAPVHVLLQLRLEHVPVIIPVAPAGR